MPNKLVNYKLLISQDSGHLLLSYKDIKKKGHKISKHVQFLEV